MPGAESFDGFVYNTHSSYSHSVNLLAQDGQNPTAQSIEMEFLKIIAKIDPASREIILQAYMGADKGFFMAGYMVG